MDDCNLSENNIPEVVYQRICLAYGSISFVRPCRIPLVSSLAAAVSDVGFDAADHSLDGERHPHLRAMALARTWAWVGRASGLGDAAGVWMLSYSCRGDCIRTARGPLKPGCG